MFEFDTSKSEANLRKHGIDFIEAQALWSDSNLLEIPAKTLDEPRFLVIGVIEQTPCRSYLQKWKYPTDLCSTISR